jgi:D-alanyl-D-alanine carboxypeptidase/D-alanyl-D-alanine-endopeptidase (penicillin-binding protein 4)
MSFFVYSLASLLSFATDAQSARIDKILKPYANDLSFSFRELETGAEIFEVNGKRALVPASVAKMVSTACALDRLGGDFSFETRFKHTGNISAGVLNGNLVIEGRGDPSFVIEDLSQIVPLLRQVFGISVIKGQIVFDNSYFGKDELPLSEGFEGDAGRSFAVDLTPLVFNHNSFSIWVQAQGDKNEVHLLPDAAMKLRVLNKTKVVPGRGSSLVADFRFADRTLVMKGAHGREASPRVFYRAVDDVYRSFTDVFASEWKRHGGTWVQPKFATSVSPVPANLLWTHRSRALSRLMIDINKLSTNVGAEMVALAAAASSGAAPVNFEKTKIFLSQCLSDFGISEQQISLANASGLNRESKMASSALTDFLVQLRRKNYFPEYLSSLSILGEDGTTRSRLSSHRSRGRLKTGSLRNVRTIAGYLDPQGGRPLAFALLFNSSRIPDQKLKDIEDQIMKTLLVE